MPSRDRGALLKMRFKDKVMGHPSRTFCYFIVAVHVLAFVWMLFFGQSWMSWTPSFMKSTSSAHEDAISTLFHDIRVAVDANNFTGLNDEVHKLPFYDPGKGPRFQNPLGKKVLILDADTRELGGPGGILNKTWSNLTRSSHQTAGRLGHYMFAKIHGYDYKLVHVQNIGSRFGTWAKVPAIKEALENYEFVIFLDADAILTYPQLPIEWLLNYWDISPETLVALAIDPEDPVNTDERGKTFLNTGFIVAQQSARTKGMFEAWDNCPGESLYQNCSHWSMDWPHEQGAFGTHVRYDFDRPADIKVLSCAEANGCPEAAHLGCAGKFVRHYWISKGAVASAVDESIQRQFLPYIHSAFLGDSPLGDLVLTTRA